MKALRKLGLGQGQVEVVDVPRPVPGEREVLLRVKSAGICGTDLHILHGKFPKVRPPVTLGHEFCGEVAEMGAGVSGWKAGDRVAVESEAYSCGSCPHCREGLTNICEERLAYGYSTDGGFAPFIRVRASALHPLPENVSFQEGAMTELLAVAVHAVMECVRIEESNWVLITGPGPIGLMVLQVAKAQGARVIISGTEQDNERLRAAASLGADHVVTVGPQVLLKAVDVLTGGSGIKTAFECSGAKSAANDCIRAVMRRGRLVQVGLFGVPVEIDLDTVALKELTISGAFAHNHVTWEKAIDLLRENRINMNAVIAGEFPLEEWKRAFQLAEEGAGLKYLLCPE